MWRGMVILVAWGWIWLEGTNLQGGEPGCQPEQSLVTRQKWAQFVVRQGRVTVLVARGQTGTLACQGPDHDWEETFGIHATPEALSVRYVYRRPADSATFQFSGPDQLEIERIRSVPETPGAVAPATRRVTFRQIPNRDLELTVRNGDSEQTAHAPTIWHLLLLEPELCRRELLPLFQSLRPRWQLEHQAAHLESLLWTQTFERPVPPIDLLMARLKDERFEVRRQADRELRAHGPMLWPFLAELDTRRMTAEQARRVHHLRESLATPSEDTPHRVAGWLAYDARLGRRWRESSEPARRQFALRQLGTLEAAQAVARQPVGDGTTRR
jgi:hypothetical protein